MTTIREWTEQIRDVNIAKGWRSAEGGPGRNTFGEYCTLLHTEISEIAENYRDRRLARYTTATGKPDDVASEVADCVIRLLDMCDVFGFNAYDMDMELGDVAPFENDPVARTLTSFGDWVAWLHHAADLLWTGEHQDSASLELRAAHMFRALATFAERWRIHLEAEVERKVRYNWTRPYQHGGRTISDGATA